MSYLLKARGNKERRPEPGDGVVDKGFRKVYLVHSDGSYRRVDDPEARSLAIAKAKQALADAAARRGEAPRGE